MHVHFVGVCGTGMGTLAMLFREAGHRVTGSDLAFDPPMGPTLLQAGIECWRGYHAKHLDPAPDLVIVGNAIRRENPEAVASESLVRTSMSEALRAHFLVGRRPIVVCGTHGKTTTSSLVAWLLHEAGLEPGRFVGGLPKNFPSGGAIGFSKKRPQGPLSPFVVEGDEYDAVYWKKEPKFLDYVGVSQEDVVLLTSVEHDHVDIYPSHDAYEAAFLRLSSAIPKGGTLVYATGDEAVLRVVAHSSASRVSCALDGQGNATPDWLGMPAPPDGNGFSQFDLFAGGVSCGRFRMPLPGKYNMLNAVMAIAACAHAYGVSMGTLRKALSEFRGVGRRQDLLGEPSGIRVYDDFAHHPTAVDVTLRGLREKHPDGALWAVFEPRSATACRSVHQAAYGAAFDAATHVLFAPLGRSNIPEAEALSLAEVSRAVGDKARAYDNLEAILERLTQETRAGDTVAILSNGSFGGFHGRLVEALKARPA